MGLKNKSINNKKIKINNRSKNIKKSKKFLLKGGIDCKSFVNDADCRAHVPECLWNVFKKQCIDNPQNPQKSQKSQKVAVAMDHTKENPSLTNANPIHEKDNVIDLSTATLEQIEAVSRDGLPYINAVDLSKATYRQIMAAGLRGLPFKNAVDISTFSPEDFDVVSRFRLPVVGYIDAKTAPSERIRNAVMYIPGKRVINCDPPPVEWQQAYPESVIALWYAWDALQREHGVTQPESRYDAFLKSFYNQKY